MSSVIVMLIRRSAVLLHFNDFPVYKENSIRFHRNESS